MSKLIEYFGEEWYVALKHVLHSDYFSRVGKKLKPSQFSTEVIYPSREDMFKAFRLCPLSKVKVVILGTEPYQSVNATGLAFSNRNLIGVSPSLTKIFKEVENDIYGGFILDQEPNLERWAEQGVLLLNTALSISEGEDHYPMWHKLIVNTISALPNPAVVFMLWGDRPKKFIEHIDRECNYILTATDPLSEEFQGCSHFSKANMVLTEVAKAKGIVPQNHTIQW